MTLVLLVGLEVLDSQELKVQQGNLDHLVPLALPELLACLVLLALQGPLVYLEPLEPLDPQEQRVRQDRPGPKVSKEAQVGLDCQVLLVTLDRKGRPEM